ncbi:glycosyltransferase family 2 protein [Flavobacterium sp.]|uniref:glycosyltransferase family 2 protein n=1 Tax=Flavobacterium sp. TaxID=239 RepID=UPI003D13F7EE
MKINTPLFSIIVIFFDEEELLTRCLDSVRNQSFQDFQLILVNDGSTDNSLTITKSYHSFFKNIDIVTLTNSGHGKARNEGMKLVRGKYVTFLDADDEFCSTALELFAKQIQETNADLVISDFHSIDENLKNSLKTKWLSSYKSQMSSEDVLKILYYGGLTEPVWAKAFKTSIVNKIDFKENMLFEDRCFVIEAILKSNSVSFLGKKLVYNYRRPNSSTRKTLDKKRITDAYHLFLNERDLLIQYTIFDQYKTQVYKNALDYLMDTYIIMLVDSERIINLNELRAHFSNTFSNYILNLKSDNIHFSLKNRIAIVLLQLPNSLGWKMTNLLIKALKKRRHKQIEIIKNSVNK